MVTLISNPINLSLSLVFPGFHHYTRLVSHEYSTYLGFLIFQWLETRPNRSACPVCKAGISRDKVIPLYGRGSGDQTDPRDKTPPRPQGQRSEPENNGVRLMILSCSS